LQEESLTEEFIEAEADWEQMAAVCEAAGERMITFSADPELAETEMDAACAQSAALCFVIQKTHADPSNWSVKNRQFTIDELLKYYGR
jgi:adenosine/AMP kinase